MKTPQEQAEAMARKVGLARYGTNPTYSFDAVMKIIPLPELIAVALAARQYAGPISECCRCCPFEGL